MRICCLCRVSVYQALFRFAAESVGIPNMMSWNPPHADCRAQVCRSHCAVIAARGGPRPECCRPCTPANQVNSQQAKPSGAPAPAVPAQAQPAQPTAAPAQTPQVASAPKPASTAPGRRRNRAEPRPGVLSPGAGQCVRGRRRSQRAAPTSKSARSKSTSSRSKPIPIPLN